jgi:hypothetical protein
MLILKISDVDKKKKLFVHDNAVGLKKKTYLENVFLKIQYQHVVGAARLTFS